MAIDAVFPAASELVMVYAGALASGAFAGQHAVLFGTTSGRRPGPTWCSRSRARSATCSARSPAGGSASTAAGRWRSGARALLHLGPERLARAERWFDRWDDWAVLLGRITPVVRSFVSIPAGVFRMPFGRYTLLTIPGSALWCFALAAVGWAAGASYTQSTMPSTTSRSRSWQESCCSSCTWS